MKKTVIITGGSRGIGRQIALDFIEEGYNVCITYNKSEKEAKELVKLGINIYKLDILDTSNYHIVINDVINKFGKIDCLVNNAGISSYNLLTDTNFKEITSVINTNLSCLIDFTREVIKNMIKNKSGNIINIASIWGEYGASMETVYSSSKAGVIGFTKALSKEVGLSNIRVNSVSPGCIYTDMIKHLNEDELNEIKNNISLNKIGTPKDISSVVTFLSSDKSSYITGQNIIVDGGC